MIHNNRPAGACGGGKKRHGPSSFNMQDSKLVFDNLQIKPGDTVLDLGCGPGDYSMHLASLVKKQGTVYSLDKRDEAIKRLKEENVETIIPIVHDITTPLPLQDSSVDLCLITTVLHILDLKKHGQAIFDEIHRVLKPGGELAIIECKKEDQPWGPPKERRLSAQDVETVVAPCGFSTDTVVDLGVTYMITFQPDKPQ